MDAPNSLHPTDQTLNDYGLGKLDDKLASTVNAHLEGCPDCRQRVAGLTVDSFLGRLREVHKPSARSIPGGSLDASPLSFVQAKAPSSPPSMDTLPPGLADHPDYEIKRELGRGGMGVVYLAHNTMMGRDEVLKVMGRHVMDRPGALERFQREIRAVAQLRHPNIVAAYTAFHIEGGLVFAMEYVEGLDLSRLVETKGPLSVTYATYFVHQAALGLQHAHEKGLIHRDIKPQNLMLTPDGKSRIVKVLDFGLAKATREQKVDGGLTIEGQALGTPAYIAPEQIMNAVDVDIRADLYSLGGTLFYLLTGRPPFQGNTLYDIYQAHISRDADPLNLIRPEVPAELAALAAKMMAKDPKRRFQTPGEVAEAMKPFFRKAGASPKNPGSDVSQLGEANRSRPMKGGVPPQRQATDAGGSVVSTRGEVAPTQVEPSWESLIKVREKKRPEESESAFAGSRPRSSWRVGAAVAGTAFLGLAITLGVIFRTRTSDGGTLIVEVNEPGAVVTVDKEPVTVTWDANRKRAEIKVRPGEREVQVTKDGFTAKGTKVTISEGDRVIVTATLEPGPSVGNKAPISGGLPPGIPNEPAPEKVAAPDGKSMREGMPEGLPPTADAPAKNAESPVRKPVDLPPILPAVVDAGEWRVEGKELIQSGPGTILLGDKSLSDYDWKFQGQIVSGDEGFVALFHRTDGATVRFFHVGERGGRTVDLGFLYKGKEGARPPKQMKIAKGRWYNVLIKVRGSKVSCFLDDKELFKDEDKRFTNGWIGLATWAAAARYRDIVITTPEGKPLWSGLPELPGQAAGNMP